VARSSDRDGLSARSCASSAKLASTCVSRRSFGRLEIMAEKSQMIRVSRVVSAPAERIFAFLANTDNHPVLDTSGMVQASADHVTITAVGQVFVMDMHNEIKGDHQVANHVVVYEPDRALGWAPGEPGNEPAGHTYVRRFEPAGEDRTVVSQTYDWSAFTHLEMLSHLPVVNREQLQQSLARLADAVEAYRGLGGQVTLRCTWAPTPDQDPDGDCATIR
jgi:uncharacterized protein YndB with AHSA1/START domain